MDMKESPWFSILFIGGVLARIWIVCLPLEILITRIVPDDAFYYLVVARNASRGFGLSFNGWSPSNGFHPLWALVLIPVYSLIYDNEISLRVALLAAALLDVAAAWILAHVAERVVRGSRNLVAILYLLNPRLVFSAASGLETSLAMVCLALFLLSTIKVYQGKGPRSWAIMGLTAAITFLSRTDTIIIIGIVLISLIIEKSMVHSSIHSMTWKSKKELVINLCAFILVGTFATLPWFLWSYLRIGTILQSSTIAIPEMVQYRIDQGNDVWKELLWPMINFSFRYSVIYPGLGWIILVGSQIIPKLNVSSLALGGHNRLTSRREGKLGRNLRMEYLSWGTIAGSLLLIGVHTFIRRFSRPWYFVPLAGMVAFAGAMLCAKNKPKVSARAKNSIIGAFVLVTLLHGARIARATTYPGQEDLLSAGIWMQSNLPDSTVVGAFNSGILAYFSELHVVNLDGVVDWGALGARREKRLVNYLANQGGQYLVDWDSSIWDTFVQFLGAETRDIVEIARFGGKDSPYGPVIVYKLHR